jgi:hypothetical protein
MRVSTGSGPSLSHPAARTWSRIGLGGFAFFLAKGLLWLLAPVLLAVFR